ncbi:M56 family metallopeptidase [Kineococcus gynurae]|uniref:M56 family metallopeptidase n=1 Tax=Kineococcus gynurae TaxID=452979 RepID=A0ABV5LR58_9ACTN
MTAFWFAALALVLAGPVPALLARATWTHRVPRAALVLWQAVALAAVLATLGAGLASLTLLFTETPGLPFLARHGVVETILIGLGSLLVAIVTTRFWTVALLVGIRTRRRRNRHRDLVDLLDDRAQLLGRLDSALLGGAGLRVLSGPGRVAYCVPGQVPRRGGQRVVVSDAVLTTLAPAEVEAVVAHERCHLRARHDLVLEAFTALHAAFPIVVSSRAALDAVRLLVEMLADDAARRVSGPVPLARALLVLAGDPQISTDPAAMPVTEGAVARVRRLTGPAGYSRALAVATYGLALALLLLPTLAVAVPWLVSSVTALGAL